MTTEGCFRYKGIVVKPSPQRMGGDEGSQFWKGSYLLEIHTGPEVFHKPYIVPGIFNSERAALAAIIPHARHTIDAKLGEDQ